jgi:N-acetyl-gamma-glutamyl-phosphate reductase
MIGGELLRLLALHPRVGKITAVSKSNAGRAAHEAHKALLHLPPIEFVDLAAEDLAQQADVVFCTMAHGDSQKIMPALIASEVRCVIDLGADFRLRDAQAFAAYYGPHTQPALLSQFVYGLPEVFAARIRGARLVANPGCFATAAQLLLLPLAAARLLPDTTAVFAVTGSSGAGVTPKPSTHHPFRANNLFAYKMLAHQHEAEIDQTLSDVAAQAARVRLLSHSGPFVRGIHATAYLRDAALAALDLPRMYRDFYRASPFVLVLDRPPEIGEVAGTNFAHVHVVQRGDEVELLLTLDNLIKGGAGQAIQNMNLAFGFPETAGLEYPGAFPC